MRLFFIVIICLLHFARPACCGPSETHSIATVAQVEQWFDVYDRVRCEAELSGSEKLQLIRIRRPSRSAALKAVIYRVAAKYERASASMAELQAPPEARELSEGYIRYFIHARKLLLEYVLDDQREGLSESVLVQEKKELRALDNANKILDENLRRRFGIPKHHHRQFVQQNHS